VVFERTRIIKERFKRYEFYQPLRDRTLAMVFEKASTRTRVSFEAGMYQMGGSVIHITTGDSQLGRAEPIEDTARVISRMVDVVMIRTYEQSKIERFAAYSRVPVINGLTNEYTRAKSWPISSLTRTSRPDRRARGMDRRCQQHGVHLDRGGAASRLQGQRVDPPGYALDVRLARPVRTSRVRGSDGGRTRRRSGDDGCLDQHGYESENEARKAAFADWCVDEEMMRVARPDALFMHCLRRTAARKSLPASLTVRSRSSGMRQKTGFMRKRR